MSQSPTSNHPTITRSPSAINRPDFATTKPYSEIANELPAPPTVQSPNHQMPKIADEYTIPGNHVSLTKHPWNEGAMPWRSWRSKFSTISALYVLAARHATPPGDARRAVHAVYSPPQDQVDSHKAIRHWRVKATEVAQQSGIRGGMAAFHGFRVQPDIIDEFKTHIANTEFDETATDVLLWEWLRRSNWRDYVRWGPHIHIVGLSEYLEPHKDEGIFHRLRTFETYDNMNTPAIAEHRAVAKDIMDHVTFRPDKAFPPIAWFGTLKGSKWWSAEQFVDDNTLDDIRDHLINGPSNPAL